ncbi:MAG: ABC transporter ATP-binding protein [Candidatus Aminicenantes bacterium]|nr:ABC transporter ATP-binding protein [Candidatus Aminicenantes bacterium]
MKALEIKKLKKTFKSNFLFKKYEILKGIDINVEEGEIYGFLGPNGAGKTTTIKCVLGIIFPDAGEISIFGKSYNTGEARKKVGFLPEHPYFYDYLTARELLTFTGNLFSLPKKQVSNRADELIKLVGLEKKRELKLKKYSKGMIQRVGLAQSLINDPDLVILDEPFSGLDPIGRKELRDIIISLKEAGKTLFFSSHILQDMEMIVDKVGIILDGSIRKEGRLSDLISHSVRYYETVFTGVAEAALRENNLETNRLDNNYIIKSESEKDANDIIRFVNGHKGQIVSVTPVKMTLEDIFLKEIVG